MTETDPRLAASLDRLVPKRDETVEWDDVVSRLQAGHPRQPLRPRWPRAVLAVAAVCAATAIALVVASPWQGGPSVIGKASAAISAPSPGQVIYESTRFPATGALCVSATSPGLAHRPCPDAFVARSKLWVQGGTGDRTFRSLTTTVLPQVLVGRAFRIVPFGNALSVLHPRRLVVEAGGTLGPTHMKNVLYRQADQKTLILYTQAPTAITSESLDPVALIRHALADGNAHAAGQAVIGGRKVERIDVKLHGPDGQVGSATYYVDASTYAPVEIVAGKAGAAFLIFPYEAVLGLMNGSVTLGFTQFRYLPATARNLALTNIRAQHPTAKVVCGQEFGLPDC